MHASARRRFTQADQAMFADLSGDANPMHMDAVAARRTQAGVPVVHGIHALLWALESLAASGLQLCRLRHLRASFARFIPVGQECEVELGRHDANGARASVLAGGSAALAVALSFGPRRPSAPCRWREAVPQATGPAHLALADMARSSGRLAAPVPDAAVAAAFPRAAAALSARFLSGLAQSSRLVGMVCPGLHSIYAGLTVELTEPQPGADGLGFACTKVDERFRLVELAIEGCGLTGKVSAFARHPPVAPPAMAGIARLVAAGEFGGTTALVVGGSRGLGAATAMLLAAGGAQVSITYAQGRQDAADVQHAIETACGPGTCAVLAYDAAGPAAPQFARLAAAPNQLYYFATPQIWQHKPGVFAPALYGRFSRFYVDAFHECCQAVQRTCRTAFYPSSVFVTQRPAGLLEYAMAKAAGELLCTEMQASEGWTIVQSRLPRVLTDQTATLANVENADPIETMLPLVRAMHRT